MRKLLSMKTLLIGLLFIYSCGHAPRIENKNPVPKYENIVFKSYRNTSRTPASYLNKTTKLVKSSNKTVYFLGLYDQYNRLKQFTDHNVREVDSCPRFHNDFLDYQKTHQISYNRSEQKKTWSFGKMVKLIRGNIKKLTLPELNLATEENKKLSELSSLRREDISKAIAIHANNTKKEIEKICLTGNTENYYIYTNLVDYMEKNPSYKNSKSAFDTLMKTTLFSNIVLLKSLNTTKGTNRTLASNFNYIEQEIMLRLNASWAKPLINNVKQAKNNLLKNVKPTTR